MSELQQRLEKVILRLERMGMRAEQALADAMQAAREADVEAGRRVNERDSIIDREEVEIEQECIRLLALYQPAAIDLRTICTVIKVNSDLERIADLAASIANRVKHIVADRVDLAGDDAFNVLHDAVTDTLGRTVRMLRASDAEGPRRIIRSDVRIDEAYKQFVQGVLAGQHEQVGGTGAAMTMINSAKALERIGDLCTNIAEDIIFLRTGDIVRHAGAFEESAPQEFGDQS